MTDRGGPADRTERRRALDISRSFIVQAPAGSGKTELLVQRLLALLAVVNAPEAILAITFTRKAASEMKNRLLAALERAEDDRPPGETHERETWTRARRVLETDRRLGWQLRQNPCRLQLMTIDSLCALLTRRMPWLSGFGAQPGIAEQPDDLYLAAAERLLAGLDGESDGQPAIERLLGHLDNRMSLLRDLLVAMLSKRDQWLRHLLGQRSAGSRDLLEEGLQRYLRAVLSRTSGALGEDLRRELVQLGARAAENLAELDAEHPLLALAGRRDISDEIADLDAWLAICHLVLTGSGSVRKSVDRRIGFPADKTPAAVDLKARMTGCLGELAANPHAAASLAELRGLPAASYAEREWRILETLVELLPLAVLELREVFRARGKVDFIEIAGAAQAALGEAQAPEDLLLQLDSLISHILVDEFQDTSYAQFALLQKLTAGWTPGDGRTLFIVGDPMQSIYRFREADVGLFLRVCEQGLNGLPLERVTLTVNFRSQAQLVAWSNRFFAGLFPARQDQLRGAVTFSPASAARSELAGDAVMMHGFIDRQDRTEAQQVVELVKQVRRDHGQASVAVLVRSRSHLADIIRAFKQHGLRFQAQDLDPLTNRPVVQDLMALTRALLHPADRVAWLATLRAPWCGLRLEDLLALCDRQPGATVVELLQTPRQQQELFEGVSEDGQARLDRVVGVLEPALAKKGRLPLRRLVESTWLALGGPACVDRAARLDAARFFLLLEELDEGGDLESLDKLENRLARLFAAADPQAGPELQVMTIHKAKGLEFDTVIVPGIGRGVRPAERELLRWLEHPDYGLLLAPLPHAVDDTEDQTYRALGRILREKDDLETLRLFYVAATRAKNRLYLLGHYGLDREGGPLPAAGSFLHAVWPAAAAMMPAATAAAGNPAADTPAGLQLQRLPTGWSPPALPARVTSPLPSARRASEPGHLPGKVLESRVVEEGRVIGVLVHAWLQRIAQSGLQTWSASRLSEHRPAMNAQLSRLGIPHSRLDVCLDKAMKYLLKTMSCPRGSWLLAEHPEAHCELAVNGVIDGVLVRAVIDRTFVDGHGQRWVVDYKTSQPAADETQEDFLAREVARYAEQLQVYRSLMTAFDPLHPARTALYFPAFGGWRELGREE